MAAIIDEAIAELLLPAGRAEERRAAVVGKLRALGAETRAGLEEVVGLAAMVCATPIAAVNLIDADRVLAAAVIGTEAADLPRAETFCGSVPEVPGEVMVVRDARADPRWADHPDVVGAPGIRFYAGTPVQHDGEVVGVLCVADTAGARHLRPAQLDGLRALARQAGRLLGLARTVDELGRVNDDLRRLSIRDPLTGLANRAYTEQVIQLGLAQRDTLRLGVLFCDMDGFKQVNDRLGHRAGDDLLCAVAARLAAAARSGDLVARLGGDEFVVVCPGVGSLNELEAVASRIVARVGEPIVLGDERVTPSVSVGAALARPEDTRETLLSRADLAMYAVKHRAA